MARVLCRHLLARAYPQVCRSNVGMGLEFQAGAVSSTLDHPGQAGPGERRAALADEDKT
jgi:hypothetical protein